ncbi:hypothetical protein, partial [Aeromonas rivipollensis]|uniref:hypothetical protein n=1 Tax=Aeromonas rivipollensis TaxID=948519 RepID=UPI003D26206C
MILKKLYRVVDKYNLGKIVGVDFIHHAHQIEGKMPIEWIFSNTNNNISWANIQGEIVNILLKIKNSFLPTKQILIGL